MVDVLSAPLAPLNLVRTLKLAVLLAAAMSPLRAEVVEYNCDFTTSCWLGEPCEEIESNWGYWITWDTEDNYAWVTYDTGRYGVFLDQRRDNELTADVSFVGKDGTRTWFGRKDGKVFTLNIEPNGDAVKTTVWPDRPDAGIALGVCRQET